MPRWLQLTIVVSGVVTMNVAVHRYLWLRFVRDPGLPPRWRRVVTGGLVFLGFGMPVALFTARLLPQSVARTLTMPFYVWMGAVFFLTLGLVVGDLGRLGAHLSRRSRGAPPPDHDRRQFVARLIGGAAALGAAGASVLAVRSALGRVDVKEVRVPLARLPAALGGFTIVQLTDVHIGPSLGRAWLEEIVRQVNALAPDLVAITGDLVDGSVENLRAALEPLTRLQSKHGTFFVTGNHEYYSGAAAWVAELARMGIRVLRNERVSIAGDGAEGFDLAGVDDFKARGMADGHGPDLPRALAGRDRSRELVLLAHQPKAILEAAEHGVGLQLSGHTHGGQLWPWGNLVRLQQPYLQGLSRHQDSWIYVSRGTGFWGPPMRMGAPAEITKVILDRA